MVYPHWYSRFFASGQEISEQKVEQQTRQRLQQQNPQYASNPMIVPSNRRTIGWFNCTSPPAPGGSSRPSRDTRSFELAQFEHANQGRRVRLRAQRVV